MSRRKNEEDMSEAEIVAASETDTWVSVGDVSERRQFWKDAARQAIDGKRQRISIAIPERDLARLKAKAMEEGVPYQTLINSIIHKYVA
jgi:predicted DNA binding CopG/RHH family protein